MISAQTGGIPFCERCKAILWDMFTTNVLVAVVNECDEVAIFKQKVLKGELNLALVGMMQIGDSAESAAVREVKEELGLDVEKLEYVQSYPDEKRETLFIGLKASVKKARFKLSPDCDNVEWVKMDNVLDSLNVSTYTYRLIEKIINDRI